MAQTPWGNLGQVTTHANAGSYFQSLGGSSGYSNTVSIGKYNFNGQMLTLQQIQALGYNATVNGGVLQVNGRSGTAAGASANDPVSQAAEIAKQNALKAADIQANLVLKQAQAQQTAYQMQNDSLRQDFMNLDRTAILGLDRLKNRGYDQLGDQSGAAAALGLSMSGSVLENQNYLGQQVMNSFMDFNSGIRSQKNQISGQIDQNQFAIQTLQTSAAIQADSIKGLAKLQTYRAY